MYKINHFLFPKGSYEINWYEEKRRDFKKKKKKNTKSFHIRNLKKWSYFPYYTNSYIGTLRNIAHGQISGKATCDSIKKLIMSREPLKYYDC